MLRNLGIIQICVTHFCIIGIISACHNCSCFPNGSLSVYLPELLRGAVKAVIDYVQAGYRSFTYRQECDVKRYMNSQPDQDELIDYAIRSGAPLEVLENLQEIEDEGDVYESIEDIWPDYPTKEDFLFNEDEY